MFEGEKMGGCKWVITRLSGGNDRFHKSRYGYILGDTDSYPGPHGKSFSCESVFFSVAQVLSEAAFSMDAIMLSDTIKFYDEDPEFKKMCDDYIEKALS